MLSFEKLAFLAFFAAVLVVYWRLRSHGWRMGWLLAASAGFYASYSPWFLLLLLASTSVDYFVALRLPAETSPRRKKVLLWLSIGLNLGVLASFKYMMFAIETTHTASSWLGVHWHAPAWKIVLPLGISFYTFEAISYVVDVYRGRIRPLRSPRDYLLYILFFPHLLAGPIVRSGDFAPQLAREKRFSWLRTEVGVWLFVLGLFKKVILADHVGALLEPFYHDPAGYGSSAAWLATLAYPLQVYGDFSGYSDMALGMAHMLGFKLAINFRQPYFSASLGEFWQRWHVSLSTWLRDYLYFPLGGSRGGEWRALRNAFVVMLVAGVWHGASWNMVVWGAYNGILLCLQRALPLPAWLRGACTRPLFVALTYLTHSLGLVIFRTKSLADTAAMFRSLFLGRTGAELANGAGLILGVCAGAVFVDHVMGTWPIYRRVRKRIPVPALGAALAASLTLYLLLVPRQGSGFMYFQF